MYACTSLPVSTPLYKLMHSLFHSVFVSIKDLITPTLRELVKDKEATSAVDRSSSSVQGEISTAVCTPSALSKRTRNLLFKSLCPYFVLYINLKPLLVESLTGLVQ